MMNKLIFQSNFLKWQSLLLLKAICLRQWKEDNGAAQLNSTVRLPESRPFFFSQQNPILRRKNIIDSIWHTSVKVPSAGQTRILDDVTFPSFYFQNWNFESLLWSKIEQLN